MQLFDVQYGENLINELEKQITDKKVLFVTQENLYNIYRNLIPDRYQPVFIETMEESEINLIYSKLDKFDVSIGFGGGMSIDAAKYFAYLANKPCFLFPTAISVDACFSYPVAIRRDNKVKYVGKCIAERIYVDYSIVRSAPKLINLSGVGDVLSIYTGLFDWALMAKADKAEYIEGIASKAEDYLDKLILNVDEIARVSDKGIQFIMDAYKWVGETGYNNGFCYYEEGSEHYFAYAIESVNGKHLLHGQLVCLGVYIMSKFQQEGRQKLVKDFTDKLGLSLSPKSIGINEQEIIAALNKLNNYVIEEGLAYSILNEKKIDESFINEVMREIKQFN